VNYAVVGAFVLVIAAGVVGAILWLASGGAFQRKYDVYLAIEDESVAGLNVNAPVKYNGVDVGKVRHIQLDPVNAARVRLLFAIERGTPVSQATFAVLKTQGLTGIAYVELEDDPAVAGPLLPAASGEYPMIRTKPSLSARLENILTSVLAKLDQTSGNINAILSDDNRFAFSHALTDIAAVAHTLAARKADLDAGIGNAARTFDNGARLTAQLGPVVDRIGHSAEAIEKFGNEAAAASASARTTLATVGGDVKQLTAETLPELQRVLAELAALSKSLRRLTEQAERNPSGLLLGRSAVPEGPGESPPGEKTR